MSQHQHVSPIKTPRQLMTVVVLALLVPVILIILLAGYFAGRHGGGAGADVMTPEAIAERLRPVGTLAFASAPAGPRTLQSGEAVYKLACSACHSAGAAGAPKTGDTAAWAPRIKQGYETLVKHAVEGYKSMPAKGGNADLDNLEVARAVVHMANLSGAKFKEPEAPASAASPAPAAASPPAAAPIAASTAVAAAPPAAATAKPDGAKVYAMGCNACHAAGVAGAPKFGDKAAWAARAGVGVDALTASVIKGKGVMPAKGGVAAASDAQIRAAVEYMLAAAK
jgi:cytochrome c5